MKLKLETHTIKVEFECDCGNKGVVDIEISWNEWYNHFNLEDLPCCDVCGKDVD